jgi:UPF0755 protein
VRTWPARLRWGGAAVLVLALAVGLFAWFSWAGPGPSRQATTVVLPRGAGVAGIATALQEAGVIRSTLLFKLGAASSAAHHRLKAGEYDFPAHASAAQVLAMIAEGKIVRHWFTVPEGRTSAQVAAALRAYPILVGEVETPPEGALLPQTYEVTRGEDRQAVIDQMRAARDKVLSALWAARQPGLPLKTPQEAVILASIVEKETALAAERGHVASVYLNRLRKGMKLDADPTTIYGVSHGEPLGRGLRQSELAARTPYNTYVIAGLPPTPIANPGRDALAATLDPPATRDLYFVADGTGGSRFAATYDEHARNVAHWRDVEAGRRTVTTTSTTRHTTKVVRRGER